MAPAPVILFLQARAWLILVIESEVKIMRGRRTDLQRAATAKAMSDLGYNSGEIAEKMGVPYFSRWGL